jgi:hypothetical protein
LLLLPIALALRWKILAFRLRHDFSRKGGVSGSLTLAPDNAPAGIGPGSVVGQCGDHRSAKTLNFAASSTLPLPRELTPSSVPRWPCVRQGSLTGHVCNDCFPSHRWRQPPFPPLMTTMRDIDQDGFKNKNRDWNDKQYLDHWRAEWARYANHALTLGQLTSALTTAR